MQCPCTLTVCGNQSILNAAWQSTVRWPILTTGASRRCLLAHRRPQGLSAAQSGALGRIQNATEPIQDARLAPDDSISSSSEGEERVASDTEPSTSQPVLDARTIRQLAGLTTANEVMNQVLQLGINQGLGQEDCRQLVVAALERGNADLALSIYRAISSPALASSDSSGGGGGSTWPAAELATLSTLILGLARALRVADARRIVEEMRLRGAPRGEEVQFGVVVQTPGTSNVCLAVVQPHQGRQVVACASTRYEYEIFSGSVVSVASEALVASQSLLLNLARSIGLWKKPALGALHQMVVRSPDGQARTFRFATETADVPAQEGERVSVVCAPEAQSVGSQRRGLFSSAPPFTKPGQPLSIANHGLAKQTSVQPPPNNNAAVPSWLFPAAVILAGSDVASGLIDPALPLLIAGAAATTVVSGVVGTTVVIPRLKQLPAPSLEVEGTRQLLLAQHRMLVERCNELIGDASNDVRMLARLWQLQNKMGSVAASTAYAARQERVASAISGLEERLKGKLELVDGYARVTNMIEIEVEMDVEVPAAEVQGIEAQITRLLEVQDMQSQWAAQAEAQDEVERLLRSM
eukprot:jgi/Botrbrau1/20435/Bobra.145_2s0002.3